MKHIFVLGAGLFCSLLSNAALAEEAAVTQEPVGLNLYCDPIGTVYLGGTPLFDETTGERVSREDYLRAKGLNFYCDPLDTAYAGGNPLFNPETGEMMALEDYLASKSPENSGS